MNLTQLAERLQRNTFLTERERDEIQVLLVTSQDRLDCLHAIRYDLLAKLDKATAERDMFKRCMDDELKRRQTLGDRVTALEERLATLSMRNAELHRALCEKTDLTPYITTERDRALAELNQTKRYVEDFDHTKKELDDVRKLFSQLRAELANTKNRLREVTAAKEHHQKCDSHYRQECDKLVEQLKAANDRAHALENTHVTASEAKFLRDQIEALSEGARVMSLRHAMLQDKVTKARNALDLH